jgi:hypothetical protein
MKITMLQITEMSGKSKRGKKVAVKMEVRAQREGSVETEKVGDRIRVLAPPTGRRDERVRCPVADCEQLLTYRSLSRHWERYHEMFVEVRVCAEEGCGKVVHNSLQHAREHGMSVLRHAPRKELKQNTHFINPDPMYLERQKDTGAWSPTDVLGDTDVRRVVRKTDSAKWERRVKDGRDSSSDEESKAKAKASGGGRADMADVASSGGRADMADMAKATDVVAPSSKVKASGMESEAKAKACGGGRADMADVAKATGSSLLSLALLSVLPPPHSNHGNGRHENKNKNYNA